MSAGRKAAPWLAAVLSGLLLLCGCQGITGTPATTTTPAPSPTPPPPPPPPPPPAPAPQYSLQSIQHIVFMLQENRSFDSYFGHLSQYWAAHGYPPVCIDGEPANASNPSLDGASTVSAYHIQTECVQELSPFWDESHVDWNVSDPLSATPTMDGFVHSAANYARQAPPNEQPIYDVNGLRAIGYYTEADLNYYYFMASNFATSDRWFSPVMTRSEPNRLFGLAATSDGYVYPLVTGTKLSIKNIFDLLQAAGISWKVYETDGVSTLGDFPTSSLYPDHLVPGAQYFTDLQNGTLPQVALIEPGYNTGRDEHPGNNVQTGAAYVSTLINALMTSSSWKSSVFILSWDEGGGFYDHVPPQQAVSPDGIAPRDLKAGDFCYSAAGPTPGPMCDFTHTGFRVPLLVVSPFSKKQYVSNTVADYTAILKLIETRFGLPSLTKRDAAQMDMTEFFDFSAPPWLTPPSPPAQLTNGACDPQTLQ